jgi:hypothetical protein
MESETVHNNFASSWMFQTGQKMNQRALTASTRAADGDEFLRANFQ